MKRNMILLVSILSLAAIAGLIFLGIAVSKAGKKAAHLMTDFQEINERMLKKNDSLFHLYPLNDKK